MRLILALRQSNMNLPSKQYENVSVEPSGGSFDGAKLRCQQYSL